MHRNPESSRLQVPNALEKASFGARGTALCSGSRSHPVSGTEALGKGSRRVIYLWDSGKGWGSRGEVLKPRSGVSPVSVIYLEWDKVSDRRGKTKSAEEVQPRPLGRGVAA